MNRKLRRCVDKKIWLEYQVIEVMSLNRGLWWNFSHLISIYESIDKFLYSEKDLLYFFPLRVNFLIGYFPFSEVLNLIIMKLLFLMVILFPIVTLLHIVSLLLLFIDCSFYNYGRVHFVGIGNFGVGI